MGQKTVEYSHKMKKLNCNLSKIIGENLGRKLDLTENFSNYLKTLMQRSIESVWRRCDGAWWNFYPIKFDENTNQMYQV